MNIDDNVYVSRAEVIDLEGQGIAFADLAGALNADVKGATEMAILGGYYSADALVELCSQVPRRDRPSCAVRIAVGLEATALIPRTWAQMRNVRQRLQRAGFRDLTVAVVMNAPVHFHTKLFHIVKSTWPVWYVGSANPGSLRHELMVRLTGRHSALTNYLEAVFRRAQEVSSQPPPVEVRTLRDFFLTGVLCHKPPVQRLFTFDAFRLTSHDRDRLSAILAGEAGIAHARPRTEGFGFGLRSALVVEDDDEAAKRIQHRRSSIETILGFWMPKVYAKELRSRIADEEEIRYQRLISVANRLADWTGQQQARDALEQHVASLENVLAEHKIEAHQINDRHAAFERFIRSRTALLSNEDARRRLSRVIVTTDMPDI